jgi:anti-sigma factor RsiW
MAHFSEQAWVDFVRGIDNSERGAMEAHLASCCEQCDAEHDTWEQIQAMTLNDCNYAPPDSAVRMVKLEFAAQSVEKEKQGVVANLVFDNFAMPALAGIRSSVAAARQMVFEAEGLVVDLRFDKAAFAERTFLTGQVLDKAVPRAPVEGALVIMWTEKGLAIAETKANAFGEFSLELEKQDNLRLSIEVGGHVHIRVPLVNLSPEPDSNRAPARGR